MEDTIACACGCKDHQCASVSADAIGVCTCACITAHDRAALTILDAHGAASGVLHIVEVTALQKLGQVLNLYAAGHPR